MAELMPFIPSDNNYELGVSLSEPDGAKKYLFFVYWNAYEGFWYFDIFTEERKVVAIGVKVVLGVNLGRTSTNDFFTKHVFRAADTSGDRRDAGFDDLGGRVQVIHKSADEFINPVGS